MKVYPFEDNRPGIIIIIKGACYLMIFMLIISILMIFDWCLKYAHAGRLRNLFGYLSRLVSGIDFFICWFMLFLIAVYIYKVCGIPNYLQEGDETGYWNTLILHEGKWDVAYLAGLFAPRGYWCYIPQTIAQYIGKCFSVSANIVWMLIPSAMISWLSTGILPGIYKVLTGKTAKKFHIIPPVIIILTLWRALLTSVTTDLFGVVFLFADIYYILRFFFMKNRKVDAVLAGLTCAVACSFRTANFPGIIVIVLYGVFTWFRKKRETGNKKCVFLPGLILGVAFCSIWSFDWTLLFLFYRSKCI